jgi:hypothetical protein
MTRWLTLVCLLGSAPAHAGLPVAYDADLKTLRKELRFGDPLGFSLFTTPDCTDKPVYSEILGAGTPSVSVEEVKPVAAKKQKPKPAAIARVRAVLDVDVVGAALYLRVQGAGVDAIGSDCQVQVSAVVGAPGPQGPPGPAGPTLRVYDAEGAEVGRLISQAGPGSPFYILFSSIEAIVEVGVGGAWGQSEFDVFFSEPGCTGEAFIPIDGAGRVMRAGSRAFIGRRGVPDEQLLPKSRLQLSFCETFNGPANLVPADEIDPAVLGLPVPRPLYIAP